MPAYIYCITDLTITNNNNTKILDISGIIDLQVYLITFIDISAVVSNIENPDILDPTDENLLAHEKVIQQILFNYNCSVTPMRFGTVTKTENDVKKILKEGYRIFKRNLSFFKDKYELGLKIFCNIEKYQQKYGSQMYTVSKNVANEIFLEIKEITIDNQLNDLIIDNMIINDAFLILKDKVQEFNQIIKNIDDKYGDELLIRVIGPISPYSFVQNPGETKLSF